jgi:hypothetical protein
MFYDQALVLLYHKLFCLQVLTHIQLILNFTKVQKYQHEIYIVPLVSLSHDLVTIGVLTRVLKRTCKIK